LKTLADRHAASLPHQAMDALVRGQYEDVFAVLGSHRHGDGLVIRAFLPWACEVAVIARDSADKVATLERVHGDGLFEARIDRSEPFAYFFRVQSAVGTFDLEDPYRFPSCLAEDELYLFNEGTEERGYQWLGANRRTLEGVDGILFAVWAPAARRVSVVGDFNGWDGRQHPMRRHPGAGVWEIFVPGVDEGCCYKYEIIDAGGNLLALKTDPYARFMQRPPETASRIYSATDYIWNDASWVAQRGQRHQMGQPVSIYEVHAGSWRRKLEEGGRYLSYLELAAELVPYVCELGFTHIQLMPIAEYPFDGSWGYQPVGLFAPSSRFGTPDEFRHFIDICHQNGLGVLLDWVPGHFPSDAHGLGRFDGSCLYEHEDRRRGFHPDWNTLIYNYGRAEVRSFLISNANYWLREFHLDGLRVDAVASMLYLDYSRRHGEWLPNALGGRENLEAIDFLRTANSRLYFNNPGIMMIAEESTAWPGVSHPLESGGLGFGFKWNMGWMNDSLRYMARDPVHRQYHHHEMTFSIFYAWNENFVLPISHDEVVHGKGSLIVKMPGDEWQKFANLRAFLGYMWGHPGKKLLFMGCEFGQWREWNHDIGLDWHLLDDARHRGVQHLVRDLNRAYRELPALHEYDCDSRGFQWLQSDNASQSIFAWLRKGRDSRSFAVVVANLTPQLHHGFRLGVPCEGWYRECINTDAECYGGSGAGNCGGATAQAVPHDGQPFSLQITLPPLATLVFSVETEKQL